MGQCQSRRNIPSLNEASAYDDLERSLHDHTTRSRRQTAAWHREGVEMSEVYEVLEIIGQGSMGEVTIVRKKQAAISKVEKRSQTGAPEFDKMESVEDLSASPKPERRYACKTVNTTRMKLDEMQEFINEIDILRDLDHPNIVQLFEVYHVKRKLWIVTELCSGGDLSSRSNMSEDEVSVVLEQILRAVAYMHKRNVCHRDIKLENIMYSDSGADAEIKLIDFGLSNKFTKGEKMLKACGTIYTAAPELLLGQGYTEQTDIWSIGVVTFVLLSGSYPFMREIEDMQDEDQKDKLRDAKFVFGPEWKERKITKHAKTFVANCFAKHPGSRWFTSEALEFVQETWIPFLEEQDTKEALKRTPQNQEVKLEKDEEGKERTEESRTNQPLHRSVSAMKRKRTRMKSGMLHAMQNFALYGELKKTILMTMAYTMDKSSLKELRETFALLDSKGAGTISLQELKQALQSMHSDKHLNDETIEKLFRGIDIDNSGQIHYMEFLAAVSESQGLITQERMAEAFDRLDSDGKGYISKDDLKKLLGRDYNEELVDKMIDEADFKKNGQVDYEEFLRLMFEEPAKGFENLGAIELIEDKKMTEKLGNIGVINDSS